MKPFSTITVALLAIIACAHLLRAILGWEIVIDAFVLPIWPSVLVFLVLGWLAAGLRREAKRGH